MRINDLQLSELLCAKLCHDIAGPIGAINNSIDFLDEDNKELKEKAMSLLKDGAFEAVARLKFFRQAYGVSQAGYNVNAKEIIKIINDFFHTGKVKLLWSNESNVDLENLSNKLVRLFINSIIIVNNTLIYGGNLSILFTKKDNGEIIIQIAGKASSIKIDEDVISLLNGETTTKITTRNVNSYFTQKIAQDIDAKIFFEHSDTNIVFSINHYK